MKKLFLFLILFFFSIPAFANDGKILDVQTVTSKGGIEAWLASDKSVPVISISFSFDGGLALDPEDKPGVGRLVSILLDEGAGEIRSQAFQEKLSDHAINLQFSAGRDSFSGTLKTLKKNKTLAFELLRLALTQPRFDEDAITRMKNANLAEMKSNLGDPSWLVERVFNGMAYEGHSYSRPGYGHLAAMETITRADLVSFVREQFAKNVLKVAIAGDISEKEAALALDTIFGGLPQKTDIGPTKKITPQYSGKTILLPLDSPQTFINAGSAGIAKHDADWYAAVIMNEILGGNGFDSRLMKEIREKRGLTYGVYSAIASNKGTDVIQAGFSASNDKVKEALSLLRQQWDLLATAGPSDEEVDNIKSYLTGSLLLSLTSTDAISNALNNLQEDGFGPDYINTRNAKIKAATKEDVQRVAVRLLKSKELTTVLVGKPAGIDVDILLDKPPGMAEPPHKE